MKQTTREWQQLDASHHLHPFTDFQALNKKGSRIITKAEGVYLEDSDGRRILDGMAGLWCVNLGYGRQELVDAATKQMQQLPYYNLFFQTSHPPAAELATLLAEVTADMRVYREENFAPVAGVLAWDDLEQLIAQANDTEYGLAAYVYGHDMRPVWQLLRGLEFGMVSVNSVKMTGPPVPFGGVKQSGLGREGSRHGLDEYSQIKYYCLGGLPSASGS